MRTKRAVLSMLLLSVFAGISYGYQENASGQQILRRNFIMPKDDHFDSGYEFEYQYREWVNEAFGFAISAAFGEYDLTKTSTETQTASMITQTFISAEVQTLTPGIVGLMKVLETPKDLVILSGGVKYSFTNSWGNRTRITHALPTGPATISQESIQVTNPWSCDIGIEYQRKVGDHASLSVGIGYRKDLNGNRIAFGNETRSLSYDAMYFNLGFVKPF